MKCLKPIFLIAATLFLCSCAMVDSAVKSAPAVSKDTKPTIYYVGLSGLKLFSEPRFSEAYVAELPLNEKVLRYKVESGFAYVKVARTGQVGWVKNANLIWKKEAPPKKPHQDDVIEESSQPNPEIEGRGASIFDAF